MKSIINMDWYTPVACYFVPGRLQFEISEVDLSSLPDYLHIAAQSQIVPGVHTAKQLSGLSTAVHGRISG